MTTDDASATSSPNPTGTGGVTSGSESVESLFQQTSRPPVASPSLGRRISSRTTDLIAIAIVLIASLTLGRQMLRWWHDDPPSVVDLGPQSGLDSQWGAEGRAVTLEFGRSPYRMTRQVLRQGGPPAALDAARSRCQEILVEGASPANPPDEAEQKQLKLLSTMQPDVEQPGKWQIFTIGGSLPAVVGVKYFGPDSENPAAANASAQRRVLCWGLAFPGLDFNSWTAYTFERSTPTAHQSTGNSPESFDLAQMPLPPDCQRTVLMHEEGQSGLLGFQGAGNDDQWARHFSQWLTSRGWTAAQEWQQIGEARTARFVSQETPQFRQSTLQIQFHRQPTGQAIGLVQWLPGREVSPAEPPSQRGTP